MSNSPCKKCGCTNIGVIYKPEIDMLERICSRCRYTWLESPLDRQKEIMKKGKEGV